MLYLSKQKLINYYLPMLLSVVLVVGAIGVYLTLRPETPQAEAFIQTQLDTDSFNGTNGNTLTTYNANWALWGTAQFNNCRIEGSPGVGDNNACADTRNGQTWTNDQWAELQVDPTSLPGNTFYVCVRTTSPSNNADGYCAGMNSGNFNGNYRIVRFTNGTDTSLVASTQAVATGDVVNFQVQGTTLTLRVNGTVLLTTTDITYSTGSPGLHFFTGNANRLGGSWRAGSLTRGGTSLQGGKTRIAGAKVVVGGAPYPAFVQGTINQNYSGTAATTTFVSNVTANDLIIAGVRTDATLSNITSTCVTGNLTIIATRADGGPTYTYYTAYGIANSSGACSVTVHTSTTNTTYLLIHEVSGINTTSPVDATSTNESNFTTTTPSSGTATTTQSGDYIFSFMGNNNGVAINSAGSGYTMRVTDPLNSFANGSEDQIKLTAGSVSATFNVASASADDIVLLAAFKPIRR